MEEIKVGLVLEYSWLIATQANALLHLVALCEKCGKRRQRNIIISYWLLFSAVSALDTSKFQLDEALSNFLWSHRGQKQSCDTEMWVLGSQILPCQHPLSPARNWQKTWPQLKCGCFTDAVLVTHLNWHCFPVETALMAGSCRNKVTQAGFSSPKGTLCEFTMAQGMFCNEL